MLSLDEFLLHEHLIIKHTRADEWEKNIVIILKRTNGAKEGPKFEQSERELLILSQMYKFECN